MASGQHAAEQSSRGSKILRTIVSILVTIFLVVVFSWALRTFVVHPYEIPSGSMEETIQIGDMVFSEKVTYYMESPKQGDIVTFHDPEIPGRILIKRIIATGGQTIDLVDGQVYIDGDLYDEPYTDGKPTYPLTPANRMDIVYPYTVPEGELWVMGDNRTNSQDSRYFGPIEESAVTGKAVLIYWPFKNFGLLN